MQARAGERRDGREAEDRLSEEPRLGAELWPELWPWAGWAGGPLGTHSLRPARLLIQLEMRVGVIRDEGGVGEREDGRAGENPQGSRVGAGACA